MASDISRRAVLLMALGGALSPTLAAARTASGTIVCAGGGKIPRGVLRIFTEPSADGERGGEIVIDSTGSSRDIHFTLTLPKDRPSPRQIVARLESADGWLLARGSAAPSGTARIELFEAMHDMRIRT